MTGYLKELQRRNVFRAVAAYVVLGWILLQVAGGLEDALALPGWFDTIIAAGLAIGLPVVIIVSWVYEITPDGLQKTRDVADHQSISTDTGRRLNYITVAGIVVLIGVVAADRFVSRPHDDSAADAGSSQTAESVHDQSIAVLPFVAMTASQDDEFFADGLSEEILNVLAKVEGLKVAGRTSAFYYKGKNEDLRNIAAALGVANILEGSVRRSGDRLRVTAQLIKADDGFHLWSQTYDRDGGDIFDIQDEIATNVAKALRTTILGTTQAPDRGTGKSAEAQNLYLIAQAAMARRTLFDVRRARDLYAQASVLDPANPKYLAGYAHAVAIQYWNSRDILPEEAIREAGTAIDKAMNLEDPTADTLAIAGLVEELRALTASDAEAKTRAMDYYQQAVALDPRNILALQWLASIYLDIHQPAKAREGFEKVVELDPLNTLALSGLANAYFGLGLYEEARQHLFRMQSLYSDLGMIYRYLSFIEYQTGRTDKSLFWIDKAIAAEPEPLMLYIASSSYTSIGWADRALESAEKYRQSSNGVDISRLVQAQLDRNFDSIAKEALAVFEETGESEFAVLSAWAEAVTGRCAAALPVLEKQYPSLKGEIIEYMDNDDLLDAVLLAYCNAESGNPSESQRLTRAILASNLLSEVALRAAPGLKLVRIAALAVGGDKRAALDGIAAIDIRTMPLAVSKIALPIDELPVFESLYNEDAFRNYATQERYQLSQQARLLAAGETEREIVAQMKAAGYELHN
ncbi:MAG TPA: tetratricopeptide repeat protein [Woeseiaceae bacterium]|nr:tetratricopeptide repeat protein [Woeseiaceae bacterium]